MHVGNHRGQAVAMIVKIVPLARCLLNSGSSVNEVLSGTSLIVWPQSRNKGVAIISKWWNGPMHGNYTEWTLSKDVVSSDPGIGLPLMLHTYYIFCSFIWQTFCNLSVLFERYIWKYSSLVSGSSLVRHKVDPKRKKKEGLFTFRTHTTQHNTVVFYRQYFCVMVYLFGNTLHYSENSNNKVKIIVRKQFFNCSFKKPNVVRVSLRRIHHRPCHQGHEQ